MVALSAAFVRTFGYTTADIPTLADWWPQAFPDSTYRDWGGLGLAGTLAESPAELP